jgi:hypothetical protein
MRVGRFVGGIRGGPRRHANMTCRENQKLLTKYQQNWINYAFGKKWHNLTKKITCNKGDNFFCKINLRCFNGSNHCNYYIP